MEKWRSKRHEISNQCYYTQKLPFSFSLFCINARFGICGCVHMCPHLPKWPTTVFLHVVLWSFALIWSQMQLCNNKTNNKGFVCFLKLTNYTKHFYDLHLKMHWRLNTDRLQWKWVLWQGTEGFAGLCRTDKQPDAKPGTRSPVLQAPRVSVETDCTIDYKGQMKEKHHEGKCIALFSHKGESQHHM